MIRVMIVDNMPIFLEYLKGCINWKEYGFEICAEASNGKEALEMMEKFYPNVVLTDIKIPYIDGLQLAEEIMNWYPETSVILITENNEFEYARKAIKLGVCDYILKPFKKEELLLSLLKIQNNRSNALKNRNMEKVNQAFYAPQLLAGMSQALINKNWEYFTELWNQEWEMILKSGNESAGIQFLFTLQGLLLTDIIRSGSTIENIYGKEFRPYSERYTMHELDRRVKLLFSYYEKWQESEQGEKVSNSEMLAEKARVYIQKHYGDGNLSISEISRELYINQTYLRKMFKQEMGMTLSEFITKYRMHMAKQMILNTDYSLSQIAEMVGYNDVSYFSKCFKKYYNVSPKYMTKRIYQSYD